MYPILTSCVRRWDDKPARLDLTRGQKKTNPILEHQGAAMVRRRWRAWQIPLLALLFLSALTPILLLRAFSSLNPEWLLSPSVLNDAPALRPPPPPPPPPPRTTTKKRGGRGGRPPPPPPRQKTERGIRSPPPDGDDLTSGREGTTP